MANNKNDQNPKHIRSFWALVGIFTFAALLGGIILGVAYSNILQDDIASMSFRVHRDQTPKTQLPAKSALPVAK